jgi:hypothetical protein
MRVGVPAFEFVSARILVILAASDEGVDADLCEGARKMGSLDIWSGRDIKPSRVW